MYTSARVLWFLSLSCFVHFLTHEIFEEFTKIGLILPSRFWLTLRDLEISHGYRSALRSAAIWRMRASVSSSSSSFQAGFEILRVFLRVYCWRSAISWRVELWAVSELWMYCLVLTRCTESLYINTVCPWFLVWSDATSSCNDFMQEVRISSSSAQISGSVNEVRKLLTKELDETSYKAPPSSWAASVTD